MNISIGKIVNDAKDLVERLKEREKNIDQVIAHSNTLAKKVDAIQQVYTYIFFCKIMILFDNLYSF